MVFAAFLGSGQSGFYFLFGFVYFVKLFSLLVGEKLLAACFGVGVERYEELV